MTELENERLRTRCAELAAEVERFQHVAEITNKELHRLQSVIDEDNAQRNQDQEQLEILGDKLANAEIAIQSFTEQKPAYKIDYQYGDDEEDPDPEYAGDLVFYALDGKDYARGTLFYARPIPAQQSPAVVISKMESATKSPAVAGADLDSVGG